MGVHNADHVVKDKGRVYQTQVPVKAGDYAEQRLTFGTAGAGDRERSFMGITALLESAPAGVVLELWLPQVADGNRAADARTDADYYNSGFAVYPVGTAVTPTGAQAASYGSATWSLAGYPGGQLRLKSGGNSGLASFSGSAF